MSGYDLVMKQGLELPRIDDGSDLQALDSYGNEHLGWWSGGHLGQVEERTVLTRRV